MITFSIIQKSQLEGANRLDPEFYCAVSMINDNFVLGEEAIQFIQYGTSEELNEEGKGFPVLRLNEFDEVYIEKPAKFCNKITATEFENLRLKQNDVLVCRTNGNPKLVGKAAIVMNNEDSAFASYLFRVRPNLNIINSSTLVIFLNSKFGRQQIEKYLMPSIQSNFSPAKFREIKIPIFPIEYQNEIEGLVSKAYTQSLDSKRLYVAAENLLLEELGLNDFKLENDLSYIVNFSDVKTIGRMDTDYFQPKYQGIINKIGKKKRISEITKRLTGMTKIISGLEYRYIEISDVNAGNCEVTFNKILGKELPANAKITLNGGELIISKVRPTRGAIAIIPQEYNENFIASGAFSVFKADSPTREYLQVVLRSIIGRLQLERPTTGTSYPTITDEDVENVWIPDLSLEIQQKIADLVQKSHEARKKSKELLEEAKRKVEEMIEKN